MGRGLLESPLEGPVLDGEPGSLFSLLGSSGFRVGKNEGLRPLNPVPAQVSTVLRKLTTRPAMLGSLAQKLFSFQVATKTSSDALQLLGKRKVGLAQLTSFLPTRNPEDPLIKVGEGVGERQSSC